jgi:hypothetical protein
MQTRNSTVLAALMTCLLCPTVLGWLEWSEAQQRLEYDHGFCGGIPKVYTEHFQGLLNFYLTANIVNQVKIPTRLNDIIVDV